MDEFWNARIKDNRLQGLLRELAEAIADCDDPDTLNAVRTSLKLGHANHAAHREQELRDVDRKRKLSPVRRPAMRLGR